MIGARRWVRPFAARQPRPRCKRVRLVISSGAVGDGIVRNSKSEPQALLRSSRWPRRCALTFGIVLAVTAFFVGDGTAAPDRFDLVVIDAGHGGHDEGAVGRSGLLEKDLVLDVSKRLAKRLTERGITVVLTRDGDRFLSLEERTAVANDTRADLFLSIHANASRSQKPQGIETYFASLDATDAAARASAERENRALGAKAPAARKADPLAAILGDLIETQHLQESSEFAKLAQIELAGRAAARSRGVKQAPFVVLLGVQMPASLVEIGFISNPKEEASLRRGKRRDEIAAALAAAVVDFGARFDARRGLASLPVRRAQR